MSIEKQNKISKLKPNTTSYNLLLDKPSGLKGY